MPRVMTRNGFGSTQATYTGQKAARQSSDFCCDGLALKLISGIWRSSSNAHCTSDRYSGHDGIWPSSAQAKVFIRKDPAAGASARVCDERRSRCALDYLSGRDSSWMGGGWRRKLSLSGFENKPIQYKYQRRTFLRHGRRRLSHDSHASKYNPCSTQNGGFTGTMLTKLGPTKPLKHVGAHRPFFLRRSCGWEVPRNPGSLLLLAPAMIECSFHTGRYLKTATSHPAARATKQKPQRGHESRIPVQSAERDLSLIKRAHFRTTT